MKLTTIALAMTFALAGMFAVAQGGPNGTAGGPTSLSGTGPSTSGGDSPGAVGRNGPAGPAAGGTPRGGTTGKASGHHLRAGTQRLPWGPKVLTRNRYFHFRGRTPGGPAPKQ